MLNLTDSGDVEMIVDGQEKTVILNPAALSHASSRNKSAAITDSTTGYRGRDVHKISQSQTGMCHSLVFIEF